MIRKIIGINSVLMILLAGAGLIYPAGRALLDLQDPALQKPGIPKAAWRLYRNLTPRYAAWATARVAEGRAESVSREDISGTEWPVFGSVFYLWGVANLQAAWDGGDHAPGIEPRVAARDAIIAASELVIDPKHATWVRKHWGKDYLHRENVFYRMLIIAALTTREELLHDRAHPDLLRDQVESLANELQASKTGLLDDYPGQCFPGDVMAALMCIKRADALLGLDHSSMLQKSLRAFTGTRATKYQLPPYAAGSGAGLPVSDARGCANSYMGLTAPELWPGQARRWFELYDKFFWQERITAVGYREFPKGTPNSEWTMDVDAGPVIAGHGVSASAFGIGAARKNGRFDRAYPLAAELLVTTGELPNGVLVVPRLLSNLGEAPLLGEAAILWQLTVQPEAGFPIKSGGKLPGYVYLTLGAWFGLGTLRIAVSGWNLRELLHDKLPPIPAPKVQLVVWTCLSLAALVSFLSGHQFIGFGLLLPALVLPVSKRKQIPRGTEDWPEDQPKVNPKSQESV